MNSLCSTFLAQPLISPLSCAFRGLMMNVRAARKHGDLPRCRMKASFPSKKASDTGVSPSLHRRMRDE